VLAPTPVEHAHVVAQFQPQNLSQMPRFFV
jgi:hypothetical protein